MFGSYVLGRAKAEYILARCLVFIFTYFGLLCGGYFIVAATYGGIPCITHPVSIAIEVIAAVELLWFLFAYMPFRKLAQRNTTTDCTLLQPEPLNRAERAAFFAKCMSLVPDMEYFIRKWVQNAHLDDVRRDNVKDWLLWGLFDREGPPGEDDEELEQYISQAEARLGYPIRKGRGECEAIRLSFDPVKMNHRSLFFYLIIWCIDHFTAVFLYLMGFRHYRQKRSKFFRQFPPRPLALLAPKQAAAPGHLSFWARPHRSVTRRPVIFIHGVGVGLFPYMQFFRSIPRDVGILAVEMMPIAGRLCEAMPSANNIVASIAAALDQLGPDFDDCVLVANSYGTFMTTPLLLSPAVSPKISSLVLADPVAFLLHLPDVAYNFTRRRPRKYRGDEWQMHLNDCVVNAPAVASYVEYDSAECTPADLASLTSSEKWWTGSCPLELIWLPGEGHGAALLSGRCIPVATRVLDRYCVKTEAVPAPPDKETQAGNERRDSTTSLDTTC
ncbi:hypothetical protein GGTG_05828 [Gaeumannomyces tritici R3-111a-1]|uniref:AB hydrolase-1 domain-containing protein n=1 Tax=Gaeumannomyces tritici (strain R3-111a-1) TaxID=644352 RepID=J3NX20_GAET3|nr:hypothetical protein GGTG_05828 [Gaeumannomyces tritici R3-111a-1]EJT75902.1 hypothetical protein GGTG_05828 [Gaeumannomyces tritici R3-111a-1]